MSHLTTTLTFTGNFDSGLAEAISHELWHVFQNSNMLGGNFGNQKRVYGGN